MKRLVCALLLLPSISYAGEEIDCAKKHTDGQIHCNFNKTVTITRIVENGGECADYSTNRLVPQGYHWMIPHVKTCNYISSLTLYTKEGKVYKFAPL